MGIMTHAVRRRRYFLGTYKHLFVGSDELMSERMEKVHGELPPEQKHLFDGRYIERGQHVHEKNNRRYSPLKQLHCTKYYGCRQSGCESKIRIKYDIHGVAFDLQLVSGHCSQCEKDWTFRKKVTKLRKQECGDDDPQTNDGLNGPAAATEAVGDVIDETPLLDFDFEALVYDTKKAGEDSPTALGVREPSNANGAIDDLQADDTEHGAASRQITCDFDASLDEFLLNCKGNDTDFLLM